MTNLIVPIPKSHLFFTASQRITHGQNINGDLCNIFCHQYIKSIFEFIRIILFKYFGRMRCKFYTINLGFLYRRSQSCPLGCEFIYEFLILFVRFCRFISQASCLAVMRHKWLSLVVSARFVNKNLTWQATKETL